MLTDCEFRRLLDIANTGVNKGEVFLARKIYTGLLESRPNHIPTRISLALSHIAVGEFEKADHILEAVLLECPDDADALVYLGLSAKLAGRTDEAREFFDRVPRDTVAGELATRLIGA